jgi:hypothetical protein
MDNDRAVEKFEKWVTGPIERSLSVVKTIVPSFMQSPCIVQDRYF